MGRLDPYPPLKSKKKGWRLVVNKSTENKYPKYESGNKFGQWTILKKTTKRKVLCQCSCGTVKEVYRTNIGSGKSTSCGCSRKNELEGTRIYGIWEGMKNRCTNPNNHFFKDYGGRGITVCDEWMNDLVAFNEWSLKNGYKENLTLDRKDNNKGYYPDNCRWVTRLVQANNKRNNLFISYQGEEKTVSEWSRITGVNNRTILSRIRAGWPNDKLFIKPDKGRRLNEQK